MRIKYRHIFLYCFIFLNLCVNSNSGLWAFGKNKLITKNILWKIKSVGHFDVYYYGESGERLLPFVEKYLNNAYKKVTKILPADPKEQIPLFLYNNHNDFEQSNITDIGEGTGGVTEAFKNRFLVAHLGPQKYLEYVLTHEFTHEIEYEYLFGGFWKSIRLIKFIFYPLWLMEGLAEYSIGDFESPTREMYIRDAATSGGLLPLSQLHSFNHVMPHQVTLAYKESEMLVRYLVSEYGEDKLPKLLESFLERLDANSVLQNVYGLRLSSLDKRFREYLTDKYAQESTGLSEPGDYGKMITKHGAYPRFYESAVFSPDGKNIAYICDEQGSNGIYIMDLKTFKSRRLIDQSKSIKAENIHTDGNGLSFSPDGKYLVFAGERKQKDNLYIYDLGTKKQRVIEINTESAASPLFSADGQKIYFSGIKEGFRNIFQYSLKTKELVRLTAGAMDKIDAVSSPDGTYLVFSAERENASGKIEYDLCIYRLQSGQTEFLTSLNGDERYPGFSNDGKFVYFISNQDNINDIYRINLANNGIERITRVIGGNFQPRISPDGKKLLFSSFRKGEKQLYLMDLAKADSLAGYIDADKTNPEKIQPDDKDLAEKPAQIVSGGILNGRSYRFKASTDLFFPAVFYSSLDGLFLATYWQVSDFLGNHQLQSIVQFASSAEYLDYSISYGFLKYRPQFYFNTSGQQYLEYHQQEDDYKKIKETVQSQKTVYPLNRFQRLEFLLGTIDREEYWDNNPGVRERSRENVFGVSFFHDVVQRPYLEITSGWRMRVSSEFSEKVLGGDYSYQNIIIEAQRFFPLGYEHVLGWRTYAGGSFGQSAGVFRLGGDDRVRGVPRNLQFSGHKIFLSNVEWRIPLVHNINYHLGFMFPDFFFKTLYGTLFTDTGFVWDEDVELKNIPLEKWQGSYGCGLRFYTFILESYPVLLNFQLARKMEKPAYVFYFTLGASF